MSVRNSTQMLQGAPSFLHTDMEPSDIILDCFQGHIVLMEFQKLRALSSAHPQSFTDAFKQRVYSCFESALAQWATAEMISIKSGWIGNLFLFGFVQEMPERLLTDRLSSVVRDVRDIRKVVFENGESAYSEVYLNGLTPIYSTLTRPRLKTYTELAKTLINDLASRKISHAGRTLMADTDHSSARWVSNPTESLNRPGAFTSEHSANYQENTKRFLRRSFRDHKIDLLATPVVRPLSQEWASLSLSIGGLSTMLKGDGINGDSLKSMCDRFGMRWELDAAMVDAALNEIRLADAQGTMAVPLTLNLPIGLETLLSWSQFPADIDAILDHYDAQLVQRLTIIIEDISASADYLGVKDMSQVCSWINSMRTARGIEFYSHWENLEVDKSGIRPLPVGGIKISNQYGGDNVGARTRAIMRSRNRYGTGLKVILGEGFPEDVQRVARNSGVEFIEHTVAGEPTTIGLSAALGMAEQPTHNHQTNLKDVIDARSRFFAGKDPSDRTQAPKEH